MQSSAHHLDGPSAFQTCLNRPGLVTESQDGLEALLSVYKNFFKAITEAAKDALYTKTCHGCLLCDADKGQAEQGGRMRCRAYHSLHHCRLLTTSTTHCNARLPKHTHRQSFKSSSARAGSNTHPAGQLPELPHPTAPQHSIQGRARPMLVQWAGRPRKAAPPAPQPPPVPWPRRQRQPCGARAQYLLMPRMRTLCSAGSLAMTSTSSTSRLRPSGWRPKSVPWLASRNRTTCAAGEGIRLGSTLPARRTRV